MVSVSILLGLNLTLFSLALCSLFIWDMLQVWLEELIKCDAKWLNEQCGRQLLIFYYCHLTHLYIQFREILEFWPFGRVQKMQAARLLLKFLGNWFNRLDRPPVPQIQTSVWHRHVNLILLLLLLLLEDIHFLNLNTALAAIFDFLKCHFWLFRPMADVEWML